MRHLKWKLLKKEREREEVAGVRTRNWKLYNLSQKEELRKKGNRRDNQLIKKKKQKTKVILFFFEIFVEFGFYKWIFLTTLCVFSWPFFCKRLLPGFVNFPFFYMQLVRGLLHASFWHTALFWLFMPLFYIRPVGSLVLAPFCIYVLCRLVHHSTLFPQEASWLSRKKKEIN